MWFSPHHMVPFPHYYSHSLLSQLPFFWVLIIFSLTHSLPQFPLFSPPAAPTLGTLGAIVCGSQTHALPRPGSGQVCPGVRESLIPEPPEHASNPGCPAHFFPSHLGAQLGKLSLSLLRSHSVPGFPVRFSGCWDSSADGGVNDCQASCSCSTAPLSAGV